MFLQQRCHWSPCQRKTGGKIAPGLPIIAQEYLPNGNRSYRVTIIDNKARQSIVKYGHFWKQIGSENIKRERFKNIKLDKNIKTICEKASTILPVCSPISVIETSSGGKIVGCF